MASPYSDPYEEWKALGRPGGSFQAWQAGQSTPQVSGGPPAPQAAIPAGGALSSALQGWRQDPTYRAMLEESLRSRGATSTDNLVGRLQQMGQPPDHPVAANLSSLVRQIDPPTSRQWYQNAFGPDPTAPVAPQAPSAGTPTAPAGPGAFNQAWMDEGLRAYAAGQRGSDPTRTPGFDPATFRQTYAGMQGGNRSEDLARFSDATLAGWMPFYDPSTGKYRSMRGAEGWFDKPTECPPGMVPGGPNETDPCISPGGQTAPKETAPGAVPPGTGGIEPRPTGVGFPSQGQTAWSPGPEPRPDLTGTMMGLQAGDRLPSAPAQSPLTGVMAPLQTPGLPGVPRPAQPLNFGLGTGWGSTQGGLAGMMAQQQRRRRPNSWF